MPEARDRNIGPQVWPSMTTEGTTTWWRNQLGYNTLEGEDPNQVLPYRGIISHGFMERWTSGPPGPVSSYGGIAGFGSRPDSVRSSGGVPSWATRAANKAYAKFREAAVGETASLGVTLAERKEAYGMVAKRAMGLARAYRSLRRGDFRRFLKELSVDPKRKHRNVVRTAAHEASGLWLEYWFGWSPTVQDIYTAGGIMSQPLPADRVSGTSGLRYNEERLERNQRWSEEGIFLIKTGATVRLVNPDLFLLQQFGVLNPAVVAWEVVPFSFVVDWFTGFGNYLGALTDWVGCELEHPYTTMICRGTRRVEFARISAGRFSNRAVYKEVGMQRRKGLQTPIATLPKFLNYGNSKTRAATAVSLLTALFIAK